MRQISQKNRKTIDIDPFYRKCVRASDGGCRGRITIEHAIVFGGKQLDELWSLLPLCAFHHAVDEFQDGGDLNKEKNIWLALCRATDDELRRISKAVDYIRLRYALSKRYALSTRNV